MCRTENWGVRKVCAGRHTHCLLINQKIMMREKRQNNSPWRTYSTPMSILDISLPLLQRIWFKFSEELYQSRNIKAFSCTLQGCPRTRLSWLGKMAKSLFIFLFFSFSFQTYYTRKECGKVSHNNVMCHQHDVTWMESHDNHGKIVHRPCSSCISSV